MPLGMLSIPYIAMLRIQGVSLLLLDLSLHQIPLELELLDRAIDASELTAYRPLFVRIFLETQFLLYSPHFTLQRMKRIGPLAEGLQAQFAYTADRQQWKNWADQTEQENHGSGQRTAFRSHDQLFRLAQRTLLHPP